MPTSDEAFSLRFQRFRVYVPSVRAGCRPLQRSTTMTVVGLLDSRREGRRGGVSVLFRTQAGAPMHPDCIRTHPNSETGGLSYNPVFSLRFQRKHSEIAIDHVLSQARDTGTAWGRLACRPIRWSTISPGTPPVRPYAAGSSGRSLDRVTQNGKIGYFPPFSDGLSYWFGVGFEAGSAASGTSCATASSTYSPSIR